MKTQIISLIIVLLFQFGCGKSQPKIDYIITNDYMSQRNLTPMGGPVPTGYKKGFIDSLQNCFVEYFEDSNVVSKKFYNSIGALYFSEQYVYDENDRIIKKNITDEFTNEKTEIGYINNDSLNYITHKQINNPGKNEKADIYYKYNSKQEQTEITLYVNGQLYKRELTENISTNEKKISSYNKDNHLSLFIYRYNDKNLLVYEHNREWSALTKSPEEKGNEFEYLYKYDSKGNWIERLKQTYFPPKQKSSAKPDTVKKNDTPPIVYITEDDFPDFEPEVKEKLLRKIYYK